MLIFTHKNGYYLNIDNAKIYCEIIGNPKGQPLILLHGGLGNMTDFNGVLESIPSGYKIIGVDLRGHGKSTLGDKELSYAQYQSDIEAILDYLKVDTYSLFGFSDGGIVGYHLAVSKFSKLELLITLGSQWRLEKDDPSIEIMEGLTAEAWNEMYPDSVTYYQKENPEPNFNLLVSKVKNLWLDPTSAEYLKNTVANIKCSTLIMRGDDDFLFSLGEAVALVGAIDNSKFLNIPFAEHEAHKEYPEVFCSVINRFLSARSAS